MKIHIVDSVKGGSGKSTFSLKLFCALKRQEDVKPCVIDLDLLGTSWFHLYDNCLKNKQSKNLVYLNDLVKDFKYYKNMQFIQKINLKVKFGLSSNEEDLEIDAIFCDPNPVAKEIYRVNENKYTTDISYDMFRDEFMALLNYLDVDGYTDIILDMPPSSEPYSDKILHTCLKINPEFDCVQSVNLYMVSSLNLAHINSTFDWYEDFICNHSSSRVATQNNFSKVSQKLINLDDTSQKQKVKYEKNNWFKFEQFKFFFVFNAINQPPSSYNPQNLISPSYHDIANQLAFYVVNFDNIYYESMYAMLGFPVPSSISPGTVIIHSIDINKHMLYNEFFINEEIGTCIKDA